MAPITQAELKELLHYDPETGAFTWRVARGGRAQVGSPAGSKHPEGYILIKLNRVTTGAHRVAFLYMAGSWPLEQIDHINGAKNDNRWCNLRPASHSQNCVNRHRQNRVGDGWRGVLKVGNRYQAAICVRENGKKRRIHLGMFTTAEEAHEAYLAAARARHGTFLPSGA